MDHDLLISAMDSVRSRGDLAGFIDALRNDLRENAEDWESITLDDYLEALSAAVVDIEFGYRNKGQTYPEKANWFLFAELLLMASRYE